MKKILASLTIIFAVGALVAAGSDEVLQFKSKVGFMNEEDKIIDYKFIDNDRKLLIIGRKNLQMWDVENASLINSIPHQIPQFAPGGFVSTYLLLGLPKILNWRQFLVDPDGKWIITAEKVGTNPLRSAIVRDLKDLRQIATLDLPGVATEYLSFDENKREILSFGITDKTGAFARWDKENFARKEVFSIKEYKWHQKIRGGEKMLVGSGDTKFSWSALFDKQGDSLTLRDVKSGEIEKQYTAQNLRPDTSFQETTVSADEKYLISKHADRVFVWEINKGGEPKFEISNTNPKSGFGLKKIVDGRFIVIKMDEQIRIYDTESKGTPIFSIAPSNPEEDLTFLRILSGRFVVIEADNKIRVYDTRGGQKLKYEIAPDNPKDTTSFFGATDDGKYIVTADDGKAAVFETAGSGKPLYEIVRQSEKERFPMIRFLDDKNLLAVARVNRSEKKAPRTEFYDIPTGKLSFEVGFEADYGMKFTPDGKYIYQSGLGSFAVWNLVEKKLFAVGLRTETPSNYDSNTEQYISGDPYNVEQIAFSPDYRYILRYGDNVTAIFDVETGKEVQAIFDPAKVKYDKKNRVKLSGLGKAGWIHNGRYVYALESGSFFGSSNTISFWQVKR